MKKIVILAMLSAIATMVLGYIFLSNINQANEPIEIERTSVVVATDMINKNILITEEMIDTVMLPTEAVLLESARDAEAVIGMFSTTQLLPGEQILMPKLLVNGDVGNGLAYIVSDGKRAYTIAVDTISGLAGMLQPSNHVDVYGLMTVEEESLDGTASKKNNYSFLLLQDITILAVEGNMELSPDVTEAVAYESVTLELYPEQIADINLVANVGRIQLALRSPIDMSTVEADLIDPSQLIADIYRK
jgi:pilus assembly protein CpaB